MSDRVHCLAIKDEIIKEWNTQWEKHAEQSLEPYALFCHSVWDCAHLIHQRDDCAIRILGGKELEPNTEHGTIGNLYDRHDQVPHRQSYFPKSRKGDPPNLIHLEVYIDIRKVIFPRGPSHNSNINKNICDSSKAVPPLWHHRSNFRGQVEGKGVQPIVQIRSPEQSACGLAEQA